MIIIETPAPPTRERLVLVREGTSLDAPFAYRDAEPADLARAGWVTREPGDYYSQWAAERARAEKAERERDRLTAAPVENAATEAQYREQSDFDAGVAHERARHARSTDAVYRERDILAALAAKLAQRLGYPAWTAEHDLAADPTWEPEWRDIVFFRLPTGQCSWHLKVGEKAECGLNSLPVAVEPWDGHTTEEKYARILAFLSTAEARPETKGRATDGELLAMAADVYRNRSHVGPSLDDLRKLALAVAARVRQEPGLVERLVGDPRLDSVSVDAVMGGAIRVRVVRRVDSLANTLGTPQEAYCSRADVPATLARLAGLEVER